jgi:hypothetical protein
MTLRALNNVQVPITVNSVCTMSIAALFAAVYQLPLAIAVGDATGN